MVYVTDPGPTPWSRLCIRQADVVLVVASADSEPRPWWGLADSGDPLSQARSVEFMLLHGALQTARLSRSWLLIQRCNRIHHIYNLDDIARTARILTGRSVALVLSGGGARGFAHVGVMRALHEARIAVDSIGTTSIGAVIGAGWASGWTWAEMRDRMHRCFVASNPLSDYTLPTVSLVAGRKVCRLLRREFGDRDIEDLRLPYFCVSANLTTGQLQVHRRGAVWLWVRASLSIPGILPPVFTEKQAYIDGATLNNLPVDIMRESHKGPIVAVDVGGHRGFSSDLEMTEMPPIWRMDSLFGRGRPRINIMQILLRAGMLNSAATSIEQRELADLLIKPPIESVDLLDWSAFERTMELGYRHAVQVLERQSDKLGAASASAIRSGA